MAFIGILQIETLTKYKFNPSEMTMSFDKEFDQLKKQYATLPEAKLTVLYEYLLTVKKEKALSAIRLLIEIAIDYKKSYKHTFDSVENRYVIDKGNGSKNTTHRLQLTLKKLLDLLEATPMTDLSEFELKLWHSLTIKMNQGPDSSESKSQLTFKKIINEAYQVNCEIIVEQNSYIEVQKLNIMESSLNAYRTVAAKDIADVITNVLNEKVTTTLDTAVSTTYKPKNALYCRLIKLTLGLVDDSSCDMQMLIKSAIKLSKDTTLPDINL